MQMLDEDQRHTIPVQEMGNYQDYLKRMPPPLREVENIPVRCGGWGIVCGGGERSICTYVPLW